MAERKVMSAGEYKSILKEDSNAIIENTRIEGNVSFRGFVFKHTFDFGTNNLFTDNVFFDNAIFKEGIRFSTTKINKKLDFGEATFYKLLDFGDIEFEEVDIHYASIRGIVRTKSRLLIKLFVYAGCSVRTSSNNLIV